MKSLKIAVTIIFSLLAVLLAAVFFFLKTVDINNFKSQIIAQLEAAVGRDVSIQNMAFSLSFQKGIILNVEGLTMANDPGEVEKNFLEVERIGVEVDFMALLRERKISVKSVQVHSPKIVIIRSEANVLNVQTLGNASAAKAVAAANNVPVPSPSPVPLSDISTKTINLDTLPALLVKSMALDNGTLVYIDRAIKPEMSIVVSKIDVEVANFSLKDKFHFSVAGAILGKQQNVHIEGQAQLDLINSQARLERTKIAVDLSQLLRDELMQIGPMLDSLELVGQWSGLLEADLNQMVAGAQGIMALSLEGQLKEGRASVNVLAKPLENIHAVFSATEADFTIKDYSLNIGTGKIFGEAKLSDYLEAANSSLTINLEDIKIEEVHDAETLPVKAQGNIFGQFKIQARGLDPKVFLQTLTADGAAEVREGKIVDINVLSSVLDKLSVVPPLAGIKDKIQAGLPEKYRGVLEQRDTNFQKIQCAVNVKNETASLTRVNIQSDGFGMAANGTCDFKQILHLESAFAIAQDLSAAMGTAIPELQLLFDQAGQIYIPMTTYDGPAAKMKVFPDPVYLVKRVIANRGQEELQKLINKALGTEESSEEPSSGEEKPSEQKIISDILQSIFQ